MNPLFVVLLVLLPGALVYAAIMFLTRGTRKAPRVATDASLTEIRLFETYWEKSADYVLNGEVLRLSGHGSASPTPAQRETLNFVVAHYPEIRARVLPAVHAYATAAHLDWQPADFTITGLSLRDGLNDFSFAVSAPKFDGDFPFEVAVDFAGLEVVQAEQVH